MQVNPVPIVIVSGFYNKSEVATAFKAVEAGAVTIMSRPSGPDAPDFQQSSRKFIQTIKLMAEIKVVRRYDRTLNKPQNIKPDNPPEPRQNRNSAGHSGIQIIVIGASAGGPQVLQLLIKGLQKNFPLPIMIVQHIDAGFAEGFATWLQDSSEKKITIATEGTEPEPGGIYLPPGDHHMGIGPDGKIVLTKEAAEGGIRPSVAYLFRSARRVYGNRVLAILLSGMGKDGAVELKLLKEAGSIAIAQDAASSMVHGMPGEAIRIGGASFIFSPEEIIRYMNNQIIRN